MSLTWAEYRNQIRRTIVSDAFDPEFEEIPVWTDEEFRDALGWSLDTFAAHTALPRLVAYDKSTIKIKGDNPIYYDMSVDRSFPLPDDVYEDIQTTGMVYFVSGDKINLLDPVNYTPGLKPLNSNRGFYVWPENTLNIMESMKADDTLYIRYFAYYPCPQDGTDIVQIPRWARKAVAYLIGSNLLAGVGVQSARIDRFKDREDSGNPVQNAIRVQQEWFRKLYEQEIARYSRQDRINAFREEIPLWR